MDKTAVTIIGVTVIGAIYWFFFGKRDTTEMVKTAWNVEVNGGYRPGAVTIPNGKTSTITFTRSDPNTCLEEVIIEAFKIKKYLPLGEPVTISLSPTKTGTYGVHCGMNMFHGKVRVV